jgi:hypothetical protein
MAIHELAGTPAPRDVLVNILRLVSAFFALRPDPENPDQPVAFGTSGHRGCAFAGSFNEWHILAIAQAIREHRAAEGITGPLFLGMDTHALSEAAVVTCLEVLAAHAVPVWMQPAGGCTPTPVISHAILAWNRGRRRDRVLGPDRRGLRVEPGQSELGGRSGVRVHDSRLGGQNPHGLLFAARHGRTHRAEGSVRHRLRQRSRRRPARYRGKARD